MNIMILCGPDQGQQSKHAAVHLSCVPDGLVGLSAHFHRAVGQLVQGCLSASAGALVTRHGPLYYPTRNSTPDDQYMFSLAINITTTPFHHYTASFSQQSCDV